MQETAQPGLRELKRRETQLALESATVDLVLEVGLDNVTVDQIAARAHVSPRTFFNYFPSKEAALLGDPFADLPDDALDSLGDRASDRSVYEDLREFFISHVAPSLEERELFERRLSVMAAHPQLARHSMSGMAAATERLTSVVASRLDDSADPLADQPSVESRAEARALVMLCAVAVHLAFRHAHDAEEYLEPGELLRAAFELLERVKEKYL